MRAQRSRLKCFPGSADHRLTKNRSKDTYDHKNQQHLWGSLRSVPASDRKLREFLPCSTLSLLAPPSFGVSSHLREGSDDESHGSQLLNKQTIVIIIIISINSWDPGGGRRSKRGLSTSATCQGRMLVLVTTRTTAIEFTTESPHAIDENKAESDSDTENKSEYC